MKVSKFLNRLEVLKSTDPAKDNTCNFVLSHLDYSNSIMCGLPDGSIAMLQRVQNWSAKVVLCRSKYDSSTEALQTLHWLPVKERIVFKILCLVFKCLHNMAPVYLASLLKVRSSGRTTRTSSSDHLTLDVPFTKMKTFAARSFSVYGPSSWNSLPLHVRAIDNLPSFKKELKTILFKRAINC